MKKFMRIALVFALAGAALVGCTKDYSGDISDLNKEVSAIQSTLTSLQTSIQGAQSAADAAAATANTALSAAKAAATADDLKAVQTALAAAATSADLTAVDAKYAAYIPAIKAAATADDLEALETAIKAAIAATDVKVADLEKALEAYAKKADLDEAVTRIATLETNYIALEARVAALEAADVEIQKLIDANAQGIEANAKAIEDLQKKVEELLAQGDGAFSVTALTEWFKFPTYTFAKWNPGNGKTEKELFAKLVKEFPELSDIDKDEEIKMEGALPFIVNPSSVALDDTYNFYLVNKKGEDTGIELGKPSLGYDVKSGSNVWNVAVEAPAKDEKGKPVYGVYPGLSLVVEDAQGITAQTTFDYTVWIKDESKTEFEIVGAENMSITFDGENTIDAFETYENGIATKGNAQKVLFDVTGAPIYKDYFIIEVDAADSLEYDITIDGSKITFGNVPTKEITDAVTFTITAVGVNGKTVKETANLTFHSTINTAVELDKQSVELAYTKNYTVPVSYKVEELGLDALEWKNVFAALKTDNPVKLTPESEDITMTSGAYTPDLKFYKANGKEIGESDKYSDVDSFGFTIESNLVAPGSYTVEISDGSLIKAVGSLEVSNPAVKPVKLLDALCKDGVLQIIGTPANGYITYDLSGAFVSSDKLYNVVSGSFVDEDKENDDDSWVVMKTVTGDPARGTFRIQIEDDDEGVPSSLYQTREFSATFNWFKNASNTDTIHFKAQAVSPFSDKDGKGSFTVVNPTLEISADVTKNSKELNAILTGAKFVAGDNVGDAYAVFDVWEKSNVVTEAVPAKYEYYTEDKNAEYLATEDVTEQNSAYGKIGAQDSGYLTGSCYVLTNDNSYTPVYFSSFDAATLRFLNPDIKIAEIEAIKTYAATKNAVPMYMTNKLFKKFATTYSEYCDQNGVAKTSKVKIHTNYSADKGYTDTEYELYDAYIAEYSSYVGTGTSVLYAVAGSDAEKLLTKWRTCAGDEAYEVVDAFFKKYGDQTRKKISDAKPEVKNWKIKTQRNFNISDVIFAFDDADLAARFVTPVVKGNPYKVTSPTNNQPTAAITVVTSAGQFLSGLNSQTLDAHFTIKDAWGHTTIVPVTVTVKPEVK